MHPRPAIHALSLDAGGSLLHPVEPVARTYCRVATAYGGRRSEEQIATAFRAAFTQPWEGLRYKGDGRPFWQSVVVQSTGVSNPGCFETLYRHYEDPESWRIAEGATDAIDTWRRAGGHVAVTSNWDLRLGPLLDALGMGERLDVRTISAVLGHEKPSPEPFLATAKALGQRPEHCLHLGDSFANDVIAARSAGMHAALWTGREPSLVEIVAGLLQGSLPAGAC